MLFSEKKILEKGPFPLTRYSNFKFRTHFFHESVSGLGFSPRKITSSRFVRRLKSARRYVHARAAKIKQAKALAKVFPRREVTRDEGKGRRKRDLIAIHNAFYTTLGTENRDHRLLQGLRRLYIPFVSMLKPAPSDFS